MEKIFKQKYIPHTFGGLFILALLVLIITPSETTLGNIVKLVFLHAAIVQTGLLFFAGGTVFAIIFLIFRKDSIGYWVQSIQETAVYVWLVYFVSSMITTYFAWGVFIAWEEPRTIASIKVLALSIIFLFIVLWLKNSWLTAALNIIMGLMAWFITKSAITLRHPLNPIAHSESGEFKAWFAILFFIVLLIAVQVLRWRFSTIEKA